MTNKFIESVKAGKSEIFSIDSDNPNFSYETMNIYAPPGSKVMYMDLNGLDCDLEYARGYLKKGEIYTVREIEVESFSSRVFLEEIKGFVGFNTVHFKLVEAAPKPYKGRISEWSIALTHPDMGLGYRIEGKFLDHPRFMDRVGRTSYVVKHKGSQVETLNSMYTLVD